MYLLHFLQSPFSVFTLPAEPDQAETEADVESLRSLPSFQHDMQHKSTLPEAHAEARSLLRENTKLLQYVDDARKEHEAYEDERRVAFNALSQLNATWKENRLSSSRMLEDLFDGNLVEFGKKRANLLRCVVRLVSIDLTVL